MVLQSIAVCKIHGSITWRNQKYVNEFQLMRPKTDKNFKPIGSLFCSILRMSGFLQFSL